jgi:hypothetical protein
MIEDCDHPLKRLFVDYQIHQAPTDSLVFDEMENIPFEYLNDVVYEYSTLSKQKGWRGEADRSDDMFGVKCSKSATTINTTWTGTTHLVGNLAFERNREQ